MSLDPFELVMEVEEASAAPQIIAAILMGYAEGLEEGLREAEPEGIATAVAVQTAGLLAAVDEAEKRITSALERTERVVRAHSLGIEPKVKAADLIELEGLSRSAAYRRLRAVAGKKGDSRAALRVTAAQLKAFDDGSKETKQCAKGTISSDEARSGTATSGPHGSTRTRAARSLSKRSGPQD